MSQTLPYASPPLTGGPAVHPRPMFVGSCVALTSSAMMFAIMSAIIPAIKEQFLLTNEQAGQIAGWSGWGFTLAIIALGPLCDALGMRLIIWLAFVCHIGGALMMIYANGFWMLLCGGIVNAFGGGAIEAACNPLIATIYPASKTEKLNQFHMWFPGGIVIGGLATFAMAKIPALDSWKLKIALIFIPTVAYAFLFIGQRFPATERVQSGVSFGGMMKETFMRPLFLVLLVCMMLTASLELGPQRWIPPVLEAGGVPGLLVLVWITGLMAVLRFFAGPIVGALGNIPMLLLSSILAAAGLLLLSFASNIVMVGVAATIFAFGVCYFWPTMLGTAAERVPKGGAMALSVLGGIGGLFVSTVTTPVMGRIADTYLHRQLVAGEQKTVDVLRGIDRTYAALAALLPADAKAKLRKAELLEAQGKAAQVVAEWSAKRSLPSETANTLRLAIRNGPGAQPDKAANEAERAAAQVKRDVEKLLGPAENSGGKMSFRFVAPLSIILIVVFSVIYLQDQRLKRKR